MVTSSDMWKLFIYFTFKSQCNQVHYVKPIMDINSKIVFHFMRLSTHVDLVQTKSKQMFYYAIFMWWRKGYHH